MPKKPKQRKPRHDHPAMEPPAQGEDAPRLSLTGAAILSTLAAAWVALGILAVIHRQPTAPIPVPLLSKPAPASYQDLLATAAEQFAHLDIATMNLLCANGLPGAEGLDIPAVLGKIDEWAERVRAETQRHLYRVNDPEFAEHYHHSEARLKAEFIVQVLQEDCGVHYNEQRIRNVDFSNSKDLFLHGLLGDNGGTCSSMPVLYVAVGRRLGYPIKLVLAKQHVFCRWEDGTDRFNIEGAGNGGVDYPPDEYYRTWPVPISDEEMASGEYLSSLSPRQEMALFLLQRAACLRVHGRVSEERVCLTEASRLVPNSNTLRVALDSALRKTMPTTRRALSRYDPHLPPPVQVLLPPPSIPRASQPFARSPQPACLACSRSRSRAW